MPRRFRTSLLFSALLLTSACQFRACGLGCGGEQGSDNIPSTPSVRPEPLAIPISKERPEGLGVFWVQDLEASVNEVGALLNTEASKPFNSEELRKELSKLSGSPELAKGLDLSESMGCAAYDAMSFMNGSTSPLFCVFHFQGGLKALAKALESQGASYADDQLTLNKLGRQLIFQAWPGGGDAIWLVGADNDAKKAQAMLEARMKNSGKSPSIELSLFVSSAADKYGIFAKPALKSAVAGAVASVPLAAGKASDSVNEMWKEIQALKQLNLRWSLESEEIRLAVNESLTPESKQLQQLVNVLEDRSVGAHLLGVLPKQSLAVVGVNLNFKALAGADFRKSAREVAKSQDPTLLAEFEMAGKILDDMGKHMAGPCVFALSMQGRQEASLAWVYQLSEGANAREFWKGYLPQINEALEKHAKFTLKGSEVQVGGLSFDHYIPVRDKEKTEDFQIDVGQLDELGILVVSPKSSQRALEQLSQSLQGKDRVADLPNFQRMGALFAGNPLAFAVDIEGISQLDNKENLNPADSGGLGQFFGAFRVKQEVGVAFEIRLLRASAKAVSSTLMELDL